MPKAISIALVPAVATAALICGCAGGSGNQTLPPASTATTPRIPLVRRQIAPGGLDALYVLDAADGIVKILKNKTYWELGTISNGIFNPTAESLDNHGDVYVSSFFGGSGGGNINEYAPRATSPSFTYTANIYDPLNVAVDAHGNVYEADAQSGANEYFQGVNETVATCWPGYYVSGIAVDQKNDVFVAFNREINGPGAIVEYAGGFKTCSGTTLGLAPEEAGGIALDKQGNLLICDVAAGIVDVSDPPYTSVTRTIGSGFKTPDNVALSKSNKLAFVSDPGNNAVVVIDYQTGAIVKTLSAGNGLRQPIAAVDGPNAVY